IMHSDATWSIYGHISQGGALVQKGESVAAGDPIALSGHTGEATGPHLHFAVYRASWEGPRSIPTVFLTGLTQTSSLEEGQTYYSYHPGGPAFTPVLGANLRDVDLRAITRSAQGASVNLRQERVDRRELVWADNPTGRSVDLTVDLDNGAGVRPSVSLPYQIWVPAHTEVYCFHVDFVGEGTSYFKLKASWMQAQ
ncbi:MAG: M23 family metallopeptidase, partial [bacterium]